MINSRVEQASRFITYLVCLVSLFLRFRCIVGDNYTIHWATLHFVNFGQMAGEQYHAIDENQEGYDKRQSE